MLSNSRGEQYEYLIVPMEEGLTKASYLPAYCARVRFISDILGACHFSLGCRGPGERFLVSGSWLLPRVQRGQRLLERHLCQICGLPEGHSLLFFTSASWHLAQRSV